MSYFDSSYPRQRLLRLDKLPEAQRRSRAEWDPFYALDERFYECADGARYAWEKAADAYAAVA